MTTSCKSAILITETRKEAKTMTVYVLIRHDSSVLYDEVMPCIVDIYSSYEKALYAKEALESLNDDSDFTEFAYSITSYEVL